ncbi:hypothetical protein EI555_014793 [Monodon monoceros]|uniref:Small ribosomal subunit protein uS5 n=1 Tax=Monodon monoceros TaxID=40151 RepID=A0A4U1FQF7_MONMO|nr:hypothetical protein EI555_014793 [Monodon monoceros]
MYQDDPYDEWIQSVKRCETLLNGTKALSKDRKMAEYVVESEFVSCLLNMKILQQYISFFFTDLYWPADQVRHSTELTTAFRAAIVLAKLSIIPVPSLARYRLLWLCAGAPHPGPRGPGIISAPVPKKLLLTAGTDDGCTSARGCTAILGNFAKATFDAISKTYSYLTADLWEDMVFTRSPIRNLLTI